MKSESLLQKNCEMRCFETPAGKKSQHYLQAPVLAMSAMSCFSRHLCSCLCWRLQHFGHSTFTIICFKSKICNCNRSNKWIGEVTPPQTQQICQRGIDFGTFQVKLVTGEAIRVTRGLKWPVEQPLVLHAKETWWKKWKKWNQKNQKDAKTKPKSMKRNQKAWKSQFFSSNQKRVSLLRREVGAPRPDWPGKRSKTWERQHRHSKAQKIKKKQDTKRYQDTFEKKNNLQQSSIHFDHDSTSYVFIFTMQFICFKNKH